MAVVWTNADSVAACAEGWDVFYSHGSVNGSWQIQSFDMEEERPAGAPKDDDEAWRLVWLNAKRGSALHQKAMHFLAVYNPPEVKAIADYCVALGLGG